MMGFSDTPSFSERLVGVLKTVERRYAHLFEQESRLSTDTGNLVFTGQGDDPDTLETLKKLGFTRPSDISRIIRTWHYGRYRATQSVEARERLTELAPELLRVFGESKRADEALLRFDSFISGLPSGIQLFSLLGSNPALLSLIVNIMDRGVAFCDWAMVSALSGFIKYDPGRSGDCLCGEENFEISDKKRCLPMVFNWLMPSSQRRTF